MKEHWIVFRGPDGQELCAYTIRGTFEGEKEATVDLLAAEHGIDPERITATIEER